MTWCPPSGCDEIDGCIWLPRLITKARRVLELGTGNTIGEYMFGDNDPADSELLRFLGLSSQQVLNVVGAENDDVVAAKRLLAMSRKTGAQCAKFTRRFRLMMAPFLAMMDADEDRMPPGLRTSLLRFVYNSIVMPPAYAYFRSQEKKHKSPTRTADGGSGG